MKEVLLPPPHWPTNHTGLDGRRSSTPRTQSFGEASDKLRVTETRGRQKIFALGPEELLGPLNDVERKFAPQEIFAAGPMEIPLPRPRVAIVGSRKPSEKGRDAATEIAGMLSKKGVVIVSGLAAGIDTAAHKAAIEAKGRTVAVLGTSLDNVYPKENSQLQKEIATNHLAISQFPIGYPTRPENFVMRNRTMALISNASVIVEAGDTSGSLHQGWEALRLGRTLFIWKSIVGDTSLTWPEQMIRHGALELDDPRRVLDVLPSPQRIVKISV